MFKFTVRNIASNEVTHGAQFASEQEAIEFVAKCEANGSFGKPAHWLADNPMNQMTSEQKLAAIEVKDVETLGEVIKVYLLPAEYKVIVDNITAEVAAEKAKEEKKKNDRKSRLAALKQANLDDLNSLAQLKPLVKVLVQEILKDEE